MTLSSWRSKTSLTLAAAIDACGGSFTTEAVGLVYSPDRCSFVQLHGGALLGHDEGAATLSELGLDDIFECRVFSTDGELRWWHPPSEPSGVGAAVYLSVSSDGPADWPLVSKRDVDSCSSQYLLWGKGMAEPAAPGWSWLSDARIGPMAVPFGGVANGARVVMDVVEYIQLDSNNHGNAGVVEERLVALRGA